VVPYEGAPPEKRESVLSTNVEGIDTFSNIPSFILSTYAGEYIYRYSEEEIKGISIHPESMLIPLLDILFRHYKLGWWFEYKHPEYKNDITFRWKLQEIRKLVEDYKDEIEWGDEKRKDVADFLTERVTHLCIYDPTEKNYLSKIGLELWKTPNLHIRNLLKSNRKIDQFDCNNRNHKLSTEEKKIQEYRQVYEDYQKWTKGDQRQAKRKAEAMFQGTSSEQISKFEGWVTNKRKKADPKEHDQNLRKKIQPTIPNYDRRDLRPLEIYCYRKQAQVRFIDEAMRRM
jgi:hypothetical protein